MMTTFSDILAIFTDPFILRPFLTSILLAAICALIGCFVILRRMVFLVDGIAHSAFAGGALAVLMGWNPLLTIGLFSMGTAVSMGIVNEKGKLNNETSIGIIFAFAMAVGIIFIGLIKSYTTGISSLLFGSIVTVSSLEFIILVIVSAIVFIVIMGIRKELYFMTFDEELARANGMPVRFLSYLFLIMVAAIVIICMKAIGVILLLALIITPAASGYQLTYNFNRMIIYSVILGVTGAIIGFIGAYILEIATSAAIVVVLTIIFLLSMIFSPKKRAKKMILDEAECEICNKARSETQVCQFCEDKEFDPDHHQIIIPQTNSTTHQHP